MPFQQVTPRSFTPGSIHMYAPLAAGVYGISNAREWLYVGETDNIQGALLDHLHDSGTSLMQHRPKGFVFELCEGMHRTARQERLVHEYGPCCNHGVR